jgi:hypothetical protein
MGQISRNVTECIRQNGMEIKLGKTTPKIQSGEWSALFTYANPGLSHAEEIVLHNKGE